MKCKECDAEIAVGDLCKECFLFPFGREDKQTKTNEMTITEMSKKILVDVGIIEELVINLNEKIGKLERVRNQAVVAGVFFLITLYCLRILMR